MRYAASFTTTLLCCTLAASLAHGQELEGEGEADASLELESGAPAGSGGYIERSLTLSEGTLRIDVAPPDWGYMDHGALTGGFPFSHGYGLKVFDSDPGDVQASLGIGGGFGIVENLEAGVLLLPIVLAPDGDFGDIEAYGRYRFLEGDVELAGQLTLQLPTNSDFGVGAGVPLVARFGSVRLDSGAEFEFIFADDTIINLDVPLAVSFGLGGMGAYVGPRTGLFARDLDLLFVNLGVQGGLSVSDAVDLSGSFNWPAFISSEESTRYDTINVDAWELTLGATFFLDVM